MSCLSYCAATWIMYLSRHKQYTGWSRIQLLCCIPWLPDPVATDLILLNAFGCLLAVHVWYGLSKYEVLHILATRSHIHPRWHYLADGVIHGTPALIAYVCLTPSPHPYKSTLWLLPACTHVLYPYALQGHWDAARLYDIPIQYPPWKMVLGWTGTFFVYFLVSVRLH